jgi:hypothetical protein
MPRKGDLGVNSNDFLCESLSFSIVLSVIYEELEDNGIGIALIQW